MSENHSNDNGGGNDDGKKKGASFFIEDPFALNHLEIQRAQDESDELDLDEAMDEVSESEYGEDAIEESVDDASIESAPSSDDAEAQLASLAAAVEAATAEGIAAAEELVDTGEDAAEQLAREIAEDQALQAQEAAEQAAADEAAAQDPELLAALPGKDVAEIESCIEALLFMTDKPMSLKKLKEHLGPDFEEELFEQAKAAIIARYSEPRFGIEVVEVAGGLQFRTKPARAALAKKLAKTQIQRLSSGAMETLALVAYKQPCMKEDIDKVRGVDSSYFVRMLMDRKLIEITGRSELVGRPSVYATTEHFLELFGLNDLSSMPPLRELEAMIPSSQSKNPEDESPQVREMRKLVGQMKADHSAALKYDPKEDEKILQEIRERVKAIPTSTPTLDAQKEAEKMAAMQALDPSPSPESGQLDLAPEAGHPVAHPVPELEEQIASELQGE